MPRRRLPVASLGKDGLWHLWVTVGTKPNGRPDQRHVKRADKAEAEARADELLQQAKDGAAVRPGRAQTLQQWLDVYLDTVAPRRCDPSTVRGYRSKMRSYVYPVIGRIRLDKLQPHHLDEVYLQMARTGRAESTILQTHRILSRALEVALRRKMVPRNVAKLIDAPTTVKVEIAPPTEVEARRVLEAADGRRNSARWKLGLGMGLRQGEALGLRWSYVDLDAGHLRVFWQLHRRAFDHGCGGTCGRRRGGNCPQRKLPLRSGEVQLLGGLILKPPKGKSKRVVPLPPELVDALRAHREVQQLEAMMQGDAGRHEFDLVFACLDGGPVDPADDWQEWQHLEDAAGVKGMFRVHDGRHFAATFLLALGVPMRVVQELLGHSSIKVTEGYSHVASKMAMDAMRAAGQKLFGGADREVHPDGHPRS